MHSSTLKLVITNGNTSFAYQNYKGITTYPVELDLQSKFTHENFGKEAISWKNKKNSYHFRNRKGIS